MERCLARLPFKFTTWLSISTGITRYSSEVIECSTMRLDLAFMKVMVVCMFDLELENNNGTQAQSLAFLCGLLLYVRIFICLRCLWKKCWTESCASRTLFSLSHYHSFNWKTIFWFSNIMLTHMMPVLLNMLCKFLTVITVWYDC